MQTATCKQNKKYGISWKWDEWGGKDNYRDSDQ